MIIILLAILASLFAYLLIPDGSPHANQQHIELAAKRPGFKVRMLEVRKNEMVKHRGILARITSGQLTESVFIPFNSYV